MVGMTPKMSMLKGAVPLVTPLKLWPRSLVVFLRSSSGVFLRGLEDLRRDQAVEEGELRVDPCEAQAKHRNALTPWRMKLRLRGW